jgi:hypothetical protein
MTRNLSKLSAGVVIIASMALIMGTALWLSGHEAQAATSGQIVISGTVAANTAILVTPMTGYNTLNLAAGGTNVQVATVRETNNTRQGYTVTLTSANAGHLKNIQSSTTVGDVAYTARYNGSPATLSSSGATVTTQATQNGVVSLDKILDVSFAADASGQLVSGSYTDTLTLVIAGN